MKGFNFTDFLVTINICLLFLLIGSMQPQSLPHQYPAFHQLLLQPGQTAAAHAHHAALLQQPIMSQAQPVTSIAGGLQQFPYPVHQSHGNNKKYNNCLGYYFLCTLFILHMKFLHSTF